MSEPMSDTTDMLDVLRSGPVGVSSPDEVARARDDMLPWLEEQVEQLPMRRAAHHAGRRRRWAMAGGLAAAAAVALAFVGAQMSVGDGATDTSASGQDAGSSGPEGFATLVSGKVKSGTMEVLAGSRIGDSSRVSTASDQSASLRSSNGVQIDLAKESDLSLASPGEDSKLILHGGQAHFSVPPLPPGQTFVVSTRDAEVTVVGTRFSVRQVEGQPTCVRVTEGKVLVVREEGRTLLGRGEASGCDAKAASERDEHTSLDPTKPSQGSRPPSTTLAQENALLTRALAAERQGKLQAAQRAFQALLTKYPRSAFAQDARDGIRRIDGVKQPE